MGNSECYCWWKKICTTNRKVITLFKGFLMIFCMWSSDFVQFWLTTWRAFLIDSKEEKSSKLLTNHATCENHMKASSVDTFNMTCSTPQWDMGILPYAIVATDIIPTICGGYTNMCDIPSQHANIQCIKVWYTKPMSTCKQHMTKLSHHIPAYIHIFKYRE